MGSLAEGLLRLLSLLLVFLLGFLSFFGVLAGVGLFAYKGLTYERLVSWGVPLPSTEAVIQSPEVSLTSMTIEQAIAEVSKVKSYGSDVTIDFLIARYGLVLSEDVLAYLPPALRAAPISTLFTKDGILDVLHGIPVSLIFDKIPDGVLSPAAKAELSDKTFGDLIDHDVEYLLGDVRIGYLMAPLGITYDYVDGVYVEKYADPANPTVLEVIAPLRLGEVLVNLKNKSELISVVSEDIGDALLRQILGPVGSINPLLTGILGDRSLNDIIVKNEETGEYNVNVFKLISNRRIGELLGYDPIYYGDDPASGVIVGWLEDGNKLTGVKCGICFCNLGEIESITAIDYVKVLEGFYLGYAVNLVPTYGADGNPVSWTNEDGTAYNPIYKNIVKMTAGELLADGSPDVDKLLADVYVGELMGAELRINEDGKREWWQDEEKKTGVEAVFADKLVLDVKNGDLGIDEIELSTILGLYSEELPLYVKATGQPLKDAEGNIIMRTVWFDEKTDKEADAILGALASASLDSISTVISDLTIGQVTGNFSVARAEDPTKKDVYKGEVGTNGDGEKVYLVEKATGVLKALTDSPVNDLSGAIDNVKIGDAMGYFEADDGTWYKDAALTDPVTGVQKALAPSTIGNLGSAMDDILVGDAMGYYYDETTDAWYNNADMAPAHAVKGIQKVLAPKKIGEIGGAMDEIKIGEVMGWDFIVDDDTVTSAAGHWITGYDGDGNEIRASGLMLNFADLTINDMSDSSKVSGAIQNAKIGDAMGYTYDEATGKWYNGSTLVTGTLGVFADKTVSELGDINSMKLGELLGYYCPKDPVTGDFVGDQWYTDSACTPGTEVESRIINKLCCSDLNNVAADMDNLTLGDVLPGTAFSDDSSFLYYIQWTDKSVSPQVTYKQGDVPINHIDAACNETFKVVLDDPSILAKLR